MICKNCGAEFDAQLARCPYCNAMNEAGAKKQFNHKLKHILQRMNLISELPQKTIITASGKLLAVITLIICITAISICIGTKVHNQKLRSELAKEQESIQRRIVWEKETYSKLDAWYNAGDYNKLYDFFCNATSDNEYSNSIYNWRHSQFINIYGDYYNFSRLKKIQEEASEANDSDRRTLLFFALQLYYSAGPEQLKLVTPEDIEHSDWGLTEQELVLIKQYREESKTLLQNEFALTQEEIDSLYKKCLETKNVFQVVDDFIKERKME